VGLRRPNLTNIAMPRHREGKFLLDRAFPLIEGHPSFAQPGDGCRGPFHFDRPAGFEFRAGQYMDVKLNHPWRKTSEKQNGSRREPTPISLASYLSYWFYATLA
jgi:hypothetical protein